MSLSSVSPGVWLYALVVGSLLAAIPVLDLVARVARYRAYRRSYPAAERGRVWRHVR